MTYQFKSEVTAGDFWKLTMSRTYRSVAGVCNMVFTVAMILFTAKFFRTSGDLMQMLMLFGCLLFPVIQPIAIYLKAKGQAKTMPKDVELSFDDAGHGYMLTNRILGAQKEPFFAFAKERIAETN